MSKEIDEIKTEEILKKAKEFKEKKEARKQMTPEMKLIKEQEQRDRAKKWWQDHPETVSAA